MAETSTESEVTERPVVLSSGDEDGIRAFVHERFQRFPFWSGVDAEAEVVLTGVCRLIAKTAEKLDGEIGPEDRYVERFVRHNSKEEAHELLAEWGVAEDAAALLDPDCPRKAGAVWRRVSTIVSHVDVEFAAGCADSSETSAETPAVDPGIAWRDRN
jgi:hypothetical protein